MLGKKYIYLSLYIYVSIYITLYDLGYLDHELGPEGLSDLSPTLSDLEREGFVSPGHVDAKIIVVIAVQLGHRRNLFAEKILHEAPRPVLAHLRRWGTTRQVTGGDPAKHVPVRKNMNDYRRSCPQLKTPTKSCGRRKLG